MSELEPLNMSANQWQFLCDATAYVKASTNRPLLAHSTQRQFDTARDILARLNGSCGEKERRGVLLADDVGLGKTTIAAVVAWVFACAGEKRKVRILAPNPVMARRWVDELKAHIEPLKVRAKHLDVDERKVKGNVEKLSDGSIQVVRHSYAIANKDNSRLRCDLLIVDEAHRAKGKDTKFSKALLHNGRLAKRVLILTATPFSIQIEELKRMLRLIGADSAIPAVTSYSRALDDLYCGKTGRLEDVVANRLAEKAAAAVEAISSVVIRHGIDDLSDEKGEFGEQDHSWNIPVQAANSEELEAILRMDRAIRLTNKKLERSRRAKISNDPRFHVGWQHLEAMQQEIQEKLSSFENCSTKVVVENHLKGLKRLRKQMRVHPKMSAVALELRPIVQVGEKAVLFCDHHATAQELTSFLNSHFPRVSAPPKLPRIAWERAWDQILLRMGSEHDTPLRRQFFIQWLCSDAVRSQTWEWLVSDGDDDEPSCIPSLIKGLTNLHARRHRAQKTTNCRRRTIAEEANILYSALTISRSSRAVLDRLAKVSGELIPSQSRVVGYCQTPDSRLTEDLFIDNQEPDTIISIFNSPFGPDILVVTDKLSEGIDLHRYCRHLLHYELDPSPIRTVQRNGRIRRLNSWAAVTGEPARYAYPAFGGTRDEQLVWIMKKRMANFSLLLGGVYDFDVDFTNRSDEEWRNRVIELAKKELTKAGKKLCAKPPTRV